MKIYCQNVWNNNPTEYRNKLIAELVREVDADICLFQECAPDTIRVGQAPLQNLLRENYTEVCEEKSSVNYTPIFYKSEKYNVIDSGWFLYNGLNDANSKSVTWAVLEEKSFKKRIAVASTHFWWMVESEKDNQQRLQNVSQLKECCDDIISKYGVGVIVGGDFNNGENADQGDMPYKTMLKDGFVDIRLTAEETTDAFTHHDYPVLTDDGRYINGPLPKRTLDYIFTYGTQGLKPMKFEILITQKALDSSDHCPLLGEVKL